MICVKCQKEKLITDFPYRRERGTYRTNCKRCVAENMIERRIKLNPEHIFIPRSKGNPDARYSFDMKSVQSRIRIQNIPPRCDYDGCRNILPDQWQIKEKRKVVDYSYIKSKTGNYCDKWCQEMANPPKIHECKRCGEAVRPHYNAKKGTVCGWRALCDKCGAGYKRIAKITN